MQDERHLLSMSTQAGAPGEGGGATGDAIGDFIAAGSAQDRRQGKVRAALPQRQARPEGPWRGHGGGAQGHLQGE